VTSSLKDAHAVPCFALNLPRSAAAGVLAILAARLLEAILRTSARPGQSLQTASARRRWGGCFWSTAPFGRRELNQFCLLVPPLVRLDPGAATVCGLLATSLADDYSVGTVSEMGRGRAVCCRIPAVDSAHEQYSVRPGFDTNWLAHDRIADALRGEPRRRTDGLAAYDQVNRLRIHGGRRGAEGEGNREKTKSHIRLADPGRRGVARPGPIGQC
jgi:hypothetical protein